MGTTDTTQKGRRLTWNQKTKAWQEVTSSKSPNYRGIRYVAAPWSWFKIAAALPGKAGAVAILINLQKDLKQSSSITLPKALLSECKIDRWALYRALADLQKAGLITFVSKPGRKTVITIVDPERGRRPRLVVSQDEE